MVTNNRTRKPIFVETAAPHPRTQTELRRRVRSISYTDALQAVEWLNAPQVRKTAAYRRVVAIQGELSRLAADLEGLRRERVAQKRERAHTEKEILDELRKHARRAHFQEEFRRRHNAFNLSLTRYAFVPALTYSIDTGVWRFGMVPKRSGRVAGPEIHIEDQSVTVRVNESSAVAALCRLAANRELHKVRLCEMCADRWRVSERSIDRFCSQKCREAFYAKSPEYHERKAANQRRYRQNLKDIGLA